MISDIIRNNENYDYINYLTERYQDKIHVLIKDVKFKLSSL